MLVYSYVENCLEQTLFGISHSGIRLDWRTAVKIALVLLVFPSGIRLDWRTVVKICIGVADGLTFFHEEVHPLIVHRNIEASNILLDRNLRPKIADFGLAKFLSQST